MATPQRLPAGPKFRRNLSISYGFFEKKHLCFAIFAKNSKIQNGHHFLARQIFWKNVLTSTGTLRVKNFIKIALSDFEITFKMTAIYGETKIF